MQNKINSKIRKVPYFFRVACAVLIVTIMMPVAMADITYRVRSADSLNSIVNKFYPDRTLTKAQIMVGILNNNAHAFKSGNINKLMRGRKLFLPDEVYFITVSAAEASQILAQHTRDLKQGKTPSSSSKKENNQALDEDVKKSQEKQSLKISKLEKESEALRIQLESLVNEKGVRDQKLAELEATIQKSLEASSQPQSIKEDAQKAQVLKDKNKELEQKLHKSRSKLAENARSTVSLERRLNDLKNQGKEKEAAEAMAKNTSDLVANATDKISEAKNVDKTVTNDALDDSNTAASEDNNNALSPKLIWLIPLLLLAGLWFLLKKLKSSKRHEVISYDDALSDITSADLTSANLDLDYQEASLEASIKLDVARAYLDAGSIESALEVLNEVMEEGDSEQRLEAQNILSAIGTV